MLDNKKTCALCGAEFEASRRKLYCGPKCRQKAIYQAQRKRKREEEAKIDEAKVAAWKEEKERHAGKHLCYCMQCFRSFFSDNQHTLYCSPVCMKLYGGKSMTWHSSK